MAKHGVLLERDNLISGCQIRAGQCATDLDGGALVVEGAIVTGDDELYTLTAPVTASKRVGVVYNPAIHYDVIGGQKHPAVSQDDRNYYNIAGDAVAYFFPTTGVEFGVQGANIAGDTAPTVGKFLEVTNNAHTYTIATTQTASVPSFEVVQILKQNYPTFDFSDGNEPVYIVKTRFNG